MASSDATTSAGSSADAAQLLGEQNRCIRPGCPNRVEFICERRDAKMTVRVGSCFDHTDLFNELVLGVKYGTWAEARIFRV